MCVFLFPVKHVGVVRVVVAWRVVVVAGVGFGVVVFGLGGVGGMPVVVLVVVWCCVWLVLWLVVVVCDTPVGALCRKGFLGVWLGWGCVLVGCGVGFSLAAAGRFVSLLGVRVRLVVWWWFENSRACTVLLLLPAFRCRGVCFLIASPVSARRPLGCG